MAPNQGQGGTQIQQMSTPTSLWYYCSYALKRNAGKVSTFNGLSLSSMLTWIHSKRLVHSCITQGSFPRTTDIYSNDSKWF